MAAPPESVVREFGAEGVPVPLAGGRGTAWRAGEVVLKPLDMCAAELEWQANLLSGIAGDGVRVAAPLRTPRGELIVDGWTGWPWLEGVHEPRWPEIVDAGERFHAALAAAPRPVELLDARSHHWARADRVAWGDAADPDGPAPPELSWLLAARRPVSLPDQLIHGDLSGNVLFAAGRAPAVIDFSPYWRPRLYATAIVLVDAVVWHGADVGLLESLLGETDGWQLLVRAAIFRLLSDSRPAAGRYGVLVGRLRDRVTARPARCR